MTAAVTAVTAVTVKTAATVVTMDVKQQRQRRQRQQQQQQQQQQRIHVMKLVSIDRKIRVTLFVTLRDTAGTSVAMMAAMKAAGINSTNGLTAKGLRTVALAVMCPRVVSPTLL